MSPSNTKTAVSLILLSTIVTIATTLDCSSLYRKESEGVLNYLANVTLTAPYTTTNGWNFYFMFSRNFTGIGVWAGTIETDGAAGTAVMRNNSENGDLVMGERFSFRFRINWSEQTPATNPPVLENFKFGDVQMCS